ncbi:uncharacterized protein LOC119688354 [Teleopsis dalmanni]|uniref:uncharacterized protein LOC119688354 n=1 Tax=Teleopsis dalmanni TaxID=139649 RepID=UPI0018CDB16B|nr:uncharacterized protein LOC119688354 [Teleopsis dalmanni]
MSAISSNQFGLKSVVVSEDIDAVQRLIMHENDLFLMYPPNPNHLTKSQKDACLDWCTKTLKNKKNNGGALKDVYKIIIGDESSIYAYEPPLKHESIAWMLQDKPNPIKVVRARITPSHGPKITGGQPRYQIGDIVKLNCTSAPSKPVCHLSWLINGEPANRSYLKQFEKVSRDGLEMARLGLEFRVRSYHFKHGDMKLKCVAKISSLYWQSNEESVESDRQQRAPALESRETVAAKSQTHGSATGSSYNLNSSKLLLAIAVLTYGILTYSSSLFCSRLR